MTIKETMHVYIIVTQYSIYVHNYYDDDEDDNTSDLVIDLPQIAKAYIILISYICYIARD